MADEWIAKNFFSLPSDTRTPQEALERALNNAKYYQELDPTNYIYVIYLDIKRQRFGIVFSTKSFEALKDWGLVNEGEQSSLMNFNSMIEEILANSNDGMTSKEIQDLISGNTQKIDEIENRIDTNYTTQPEIDNQLSTLQESLRQDIETALNRIELTESQKIELQKQVFNLIPTLNDTVNDLAEKFAEQIDIEELKTRIENEATSELADKRLKGLKEVLIIVASRIGIDADIIDEYLTQNHGL